MHNIKHKHVPVQYTAAWFTTQGPDHAAAPIVNVNGAGDSLVGAMCAGLAEGLTAEEALARGMMAARLSVQVCGRQGLLQTVVSDVHRHVPPGSRAVHAGRVPTYYPTTAVCGRHKCSVAQAQVAQSQRHLEVTV